MFLWVIKLLVYFFGIYWYIGSIVYGLRDLLYCYRWFGNCFVLVYFIILRKLLKNMEVLLCIVYKVFVCEFICGKKYVEGSKV